MEIDSSDDEADLARWEKTLDQHRHEADATASDVKTERDAKDKKDQDLLYEGMELDMNVKPSKRKRKRQNSSFQNEGVASASAKAIFESKFPKGMKVAKIKWIPFEGKISYSPKTKSEWHHVIYDDGDEEDMAQFDVEFCVNAYYKKYPKESRPFQSHPVFFPVNTKLIRQFPEFKAGKVVSYGSNGKIHVHFDDDEKLAVTEEEMNKLLLNHKAMMKKMQDEQGDMNEKIHASYPTGEESTSISKDMDDEKSSESFAVHDKMIEKKQDGCTRADEKLGDSLRKELPTRKDKEDSKYVEKLQDDSDAVDEKVEDLVEKSDISLAKEGMQNEDRSIDKESLTHSQPKVVSIHDAPHIHNSLASSMNERRKERSSEESNAASLSQKQQFQQKQMNGATIPVVHTTSTSRRGRHQPRFDNANVRKVTLQCSYPSCPILESINEDMITKRLMKCGGCDIASYCSKTCQFRHWPIHQKTCLLKQHEAKQNNASTQRLRQTQTKIQIPTQQHHSLQRSYPQYHQQYQRPYQQPIQPYHTWNMQQQQYFVSNTPHDTYYKQQQQQQQWRQSIPLNANGGIQLSDNHTQSVQRTSRTHLNKGVNSSKTTFSQTNSSKTAIHHDKAAPNRVPPNHRGASNQTPLKRQTNNKGESSQKKSVDDTKDGKIYGELDTNGKKMNDPLVVEEASATLFKDTNDKESPSIFDQDKKDKKMSDEQEDMGDEEKGNFTVEALSSVENESSVALSKDTYNKESPSIFDQDAKDDKMSDERGSGDEERENSTMEALYIEDESTISKEMNDKMKLANGNQEQDKEVVEEQDNKTEKTEEAEGPEYDGNDEEETCKKDEKMPDEQHRGDKEKDSSTKDVLSSGEKSTTSKDTEGKFSSTIKIGTKIAKEFMTAYRGEVTSVPSIDNEYYHVNYDDGDEEDLEFNEVEMYVKEYLKHHPRSPQRNKLKRKRGEKFPTGTRIIKEFSETFVGEITKVCRNRPRFYIQYEDNTGDVITSRKEIEQLILNYENLEEDENNNYSKDASI
ncbi:predicted protein [Chaetoceros tenuissimus]|uniref:MYND-type domain-containing protein n=1 Tax=Chaetoceros tenuissimus TaxID=426638 RepID=A0AAD3CLV5_9STRA|nr:predicted protein [Chaetoceros tenuissimus]